MDSKTSTTCMPLQQLPDCWNDDLRMNFLFSPFRLKNVNPMDWDSKMSFWCDMISQWCDHNKKPTFSLNELILAFERKNKRPACLDTVVEHMIMTKVACQESNIFQNKDGWLVWGTKQFLRPVSWATKSLLSNFVSSEKTVPTSKLIHLESLRKQALSFLSSIPPESRVGNLFDLKSSSALKDTADNETINLLLTWLLSEKLATVSVDGQLYKLAVNEQQKVSPLTEGEICLYQISQTTKKLDQITLNLEQKIITAKSTAKEHLKKGDKSLALNQLRQKKAFEKRLEKVFNSSESLTQLSENIQQTHVDAEIFDVFKSTLSSMKTFSKEKGLDETVVLDTMDDVKQVLDEISNMQQAMSQPLDSQFDDDELEAELNDITSHMNPGNDNGGVTPKLDDVLDSLSNLTGNKDDSTKLNPIEGEMEKNINALKKQKLTEIVK